MFPVLCMEHLRWCKGGAKETLALSVDYILMSCADVQERSPVHMVADEEGEAALGAKKST